MQQDPLASLPSIDDSDEYELGDEASLGEVDEFRELGPITKARLQPGQSIEIRHRRVPDGGPLANFWNRAHRAWNVFFPASIPNHLTAGELSRRRLQMILVADRCGLNPGMVVEMKRRAWEAVSESLDVELQQGTDELEMRLMHVHESGRVSMISMPMDMVHDVVEGEEEEDEEGCIDTQDIDDDVEGVSQRTRPAPTV